MRRSSRFQRPGLSGSSRSVVLLGGDGGGPSLNLDFSSGTLDPRITFTRSTFGTYYRGAFNQNLVTQSETFSTWTQFQNVSNNASSEQNPFGTGTSRVIQDDATNAAHRLLANNVTFVAGQTYTQSVYAKAGTGTAIQILFGSTEFGLNEWATFNLSNGTIGSVGTSVSGSDASIQPIGNGWYRCSLTATCTTGGTNVCAAIHLTNSQSTTTRAPAYSGSGQTVFLWGAQTTEGSLLTPYIPTTTAAITQGQIAASQPWNLLLQSQAFDNTTTWSNSVSGTGSTPVRTANNAVAPDGTMTADTITFNAGAGTTSSDISMIGQSLTGVTSGQAYTLSLWIRASSGNPQIVVRHVGNSGYTLVTATSAWQRISITEVATSTVSTPQFGIRQNQGGIGTINSTATVELWGAQLNEGATALDYSPTTTLANYLPRFEYNPVSGAFRGLLIEGGATNLLQQSAAVRTSPWVTAQFTTAGASITAPDGTVSGVECVAVNGAGSATAYSYQQITATASTSYTTSFFLKAKGTALNTIVRMQARASTTVLSNLDVTFNNATGTVGSVTSGTWTATSATSTPIGNGWYRVTLTGTTPATTNNLWAAFFFDATGNGTNGVYAWGAQVEAQAFASSYIPTAGATFARAADSASITGTNFSSWYNQSEGTMLAAGFPLCTADLNQGLFDIRLDGGNRHTLYRGNTGVPDQNGVISRDTNVTVVNMFTTAWPTFTTRSVAYGYANDNFALTSNGATPTLDSSGVVFSGATAAWIGSFANTLHFNGNISRIAYWPTRLPNDQLVSLTTIPSTALAMTAIQAGAKIDLTWTQVAGVEGAIYEVERSTDGGATWSPLTTSFGLAFNDTTALFPGTYTYRVRANVGGEVTDWSSQVSETTVDVPSAPGSLTVTGATTSSISLSWTDSTGEDSYGIEVSPDGLGSWSLAGTAPANTTTFTHTPLAESVQRYYRVNGINKAGGGVYSSTVNSWTVPLAPTSLTATAVSSSQIDLAWTDVSTGNQSYKVERSTDNVNWTQIATGLAANATSYSAVGLTGSTLYYFRVRAANAARDSAYSNTASATTQAGGLVPAWSLDFSSGSFSGATLTRSSAGTFVNSSGYVASASTNVARLTHDKNGARLGLLIEESRANILTRSEDFATGWAGGNTNVVVNDTAAPDNATTADKIAANTTTGAHWRRLGATSPVAGTTYVFSCFFKTGGGNATHAILSIETTGTDRSYTAKYDTSTGARTDTDSSGTPVNTDSPTQAEDMGNGWWRAWVRIEHSTGNTGLRAYVGLSNAATGIAFPSWTGAAGDADFIYFWGTQVEASTTVPTSYIPTTTSSVTRSADLVHVLDSAITSWGDPGALVVHFYPPSQAGTLLSTDDAATAQVGIEASTATDVRAFWSSGSTAAETMTTGVQKAVHYWTGSTSKLCLNGGPVRSGTNNFTIANADFVTLGAEATDSAGVPGTFSQYANCVIRKVEFYSGTLSDANLQTITT